MLPSWPHSHYTAALLAAALPSLPPLEDNGVDTFVEVFGANFTDQLLQNDSFVFKGPSGSQALDGQQNSSALLEVPNSNVPESSRQLTSERCCHVRLKLLLKAAARLQASRLWQPGMPLTSACSAGIAWCHAELRDTLHNNGLHGATANGPPLLDALQLDIAMDARCIAGMRARGAAAKAMGCRACRALRMRLSTTTEECVTTHSCWLQAAGFGLYNLSILLVGPDTHDILNPARDRVSPCFLNFYCLPSGLTLLEAVKLTS